MHEQMGNDFSREVVRKSLMEMQQERTSKMKNSFDELNRKLSTAEGYVSDLPKGYKHNTEEQSTKEKLDKLDFTKVKILNVCASEGHHKENETKQNNNGENNCCW